MWINDILFFCEIKNVYRYAGQGEMHYVLAVKVFFVAAFEFQNFQQRFQSSYTNQHHMDWVNKTPFLQQNTGNGY